MYAEDFEHEEFGISESVGLATTSVALTTSLTVKDMYGAFGSLATAFEDTFHTFKRQLEAFTTYLRTGKLPFSFDQTVESGRTVQFDEIQMQNS